jgi:hypothetical protein
MFESFIVQVTNVVATESRKERKTTKDKKLVNTQSQGISEILAISKTQ